MSLLSPVSSNGHLTPLTVNGQCHEISCLLAMKSFKEYDQNELFMFVMELS
jgi:hypothetical protein